MSTTHVHAEGEVGQGQIGRLRDIGLGTSELATQP